MNTHDLRYIKTEKLLKEAFLRLKSTGKPFTLTQLCNEALINKTTFYKHYETLEDFEQKICKDYLKKLFFECEHIYDAFIDTRRFVLDLQNKMQENEKTIQLLFQNNHQKFIHLTEEILLDLYLDNISSKEDEIKIRFAVIGSSNILIGNNEPFVNETIIHLLERIMTS